jgi:hypothetical protein
MGKCPDFAGQGGARAVADQDNPIKVGQLRVLAFSHPAVHHFDHQRGHAIWLLHRSPINRQLRDLDTHTRQRVFDKLSDIPHLLSAGPIPVQDDDESCSVRVMGL